jgi:monoamine oxidase
MQPHFVPDVVDVVIIGAGAAGLAAFAALDRAGLKVLLLEARNRIGGRIHTIHDALSPLPLELGAEFIHGYPAEVWDIIRDARLAVYEGTDAARYMHAGEVQTQADSWDLLNSVITDMRQAAKGADQSFDEFLRNESYDEDTKRSARGYIEGFNAADATQISIHALAEETAASDEIDGDRVCRFATGYDAVALHLLRSVPDYDTKLRLNTVVQSVAWKPGSVAIHTRNTLTSMEHIFHARQAVITVPFGVLQAGSIEFTPQPEEILRAAQSLRFGHVFRMVLRFRRAFWESKPELRDAGFILSQEKVFPTWWTTLAMRSTILTGWNAGARASALEGLCEAQILERALSSLSRIIGVSLEGLQSELEACYFHDWQRDPYALGAYSYVPAGALPARQQLAIPVEQTLFFAGEATDQNGHSATVHGAIASGRRAANQILF